MNAVVHATDIQDRDGGPLVIETMHGLFPFVTKLLADGGYQGPQFRRALTKVMPQLSVEIVKRSDTATGFQVLPRRWATLPKVPRAKASETGAVEGVGSAPSPGSTRNRRLAKDVKATIKSSVTLALRRQCQAVVAASSSRLRHRR